MAGLVRDVMREKICFLIMAHDRFLQLDRLIDALQDPSFDLYLHLDRKAGTRTFDQNKVTLVDDPVAVNWGGFSQVRASLKLLETAFHSGMHYRYFVQLSGSDYPVRPNSLIRDRLLAASDVFMECRAHTDGFWHDRYRKLAFHDIPRGVRHVLRAGARSLPGRLLPNRTMPLGLIPHFGASWWSMPHDAVAHVLAFLAEHPAYARFFRMTESPDEMFFQTILGNSQLRHRIRPILHYVDWSEGGAHPKTLEDRDFGRFATGGWLFARKFDLTRDPDLLGRIDKELRAS